MFVPRDSAFQIYSARVSNIPLYISLSPSSLPASPPPFLPRCGHCKKLAPHLDAFAAHDAVALRVAIGTIDATVEKKTADRFGVTGFPTLMYYKDGKFEKYAGGRSVEAFATFAKRVTGPPIVEISGTDSNDVEVFVGKGVGFIFGGGDKTHYQAYENVARALVVDGNFGFAPGRQGVPFLCKIESQENDICMSADDKLDEAGIRSFVERNNHKIVSELSSENFRKLGRVPNKRVVIAPVDPEDSVRKEETEAATVMLMKTARSAALEVKNSFVFAWINSKNWAGFLKQFANADTGVLPAFIVLEAETMDFFPFEGSWADGELEAFLKDGVLGGKVPKSLSPKPESGIIGGAKVIWAAFKDNLPWSALAIVPFVALIYVLFAMDGGGSDSDIGIPEVKEDEGEDEGEKKKGDGDAKEGTSAVDAAKDKETKKDK